MAAYINDSKDGLTFSGIVASQTISFTVLGGTYAFAVYDTGTANATLNMVSPAGHIIPIGTLTTNSMVAFKIPRGSYQIVTGAGTTLMDGSLTVVPHRERG